MSEQIPARIAHRLLLSLLTTRYMHPEDEGLKLWEECWAWVDDHAEPYEEMGK